MLFDILIYKNIDKFMVGILISHHKCQVLGTADTNCKNEDILRIIKFLATFLHSVHQNILLISWDCPFNSFFSIFQNFMKSEI
jgi:hypothetical protein